MYIVFCIVRAKITREQVRAKFYETFRPASRAAAKFAIKRYRVSANEYHLHRTVNC